MTQWYDEDAGQFLKTGIGSEWTFTVKEVRKITTGDPKFHYKRKDGTDLGYHHELVTDDNAIYTVNTFALKRALGEKEVVEGSHITIKHPARGIYDITLHNVNI